jgi:hypothetical protein
MMPVTLAIVLLVASSIVGLFATATLGVRAEASGRSDRVHVKVAGALAFAILIGLVALGVLALLGVS